MNVEILSIFERDLDKIIDAKVKFALSEIISKLESAKSLREIQNVKKLKGFRNAYRIKLGDYRIGLYLEKNIIEMARFVHRRDIYKVFP